MIDATSKTRRLFIADAQRDKSGFFKIEGKLRFRALGVFVDQASVYADHFERTFFEIVRLLGVQGKNLPCDFAVGDHESGDGSRSETAHCFQSMATIRRPEAAMGRNNRDDRVEKSPGLVDDIGEALVMCV